MRAEASLAVSLILCGLAMSASKYFAPHAPPSATVAAITPALPTEMTATPNTPDETALNPPYGVSLPITTNSLHEPELVAKEASIPITLPTVAEQMLAEANRLGPYRTLDPALCQAAQQYADHLARTRQQGHYADGDPEYRAKRAGFMGLLRTPGRLRSDGWTSYGLGEVLAFGHPDIGAAFQGWLGSPGHKEALMESTYDVAGFGQCGTIYVGMFGNSRVTAPAPKLTASKPQLVRYYQPQTYSSCGPGGCGQSYSSGGRFRFRGR